VNQPFQHLVTNGKGFDPAMLPTMPLYRVAEIIRKDWGPKVHFSAVPYLQAMSSMKSENDDYGLDSGKSIVLYFLANATTWRGDVARIVKAELKRRCK